MHKTINILGTEYRIEVHKVSEDESLKKHNWAGYCSGDAHLIVLADFDDAESFSFVSEQAKDIYAKRTLRHEMIHAFLNESGLMDNALMVNESWAGNEEMVDWIALQLPKISKACEEVGALWDC